MVTVIGPVPRSCPTLEIRRSPDHTHSPARLAKGPDELCPNVEQPARDSADPPVATTGLAGLAYRPDGWPLQVGQRGARLGFY
jgi:hypothetical protein